MDDQKKMTRDQIVDAALDHVYTDFERYVRAQAKEHTVANLGHDLKQYADGVYARPDDLVESAFYRVREELAYELAVEDDEGGDPIEAEYKDWLKAARRDCAKVQKKGLPLTLRNSRDAFLKQGAFAPKGKK